MRHNAKRILSMVLCVLMCVSMLTGIILPAAATETPETTDPYAMITGEGVDGVIIPDDNVYFMDVALKDKYATGQVFEYTYGDGETWGNGKTYRLTFGVNAFAAFLDAGLTPALKQDSADWLNGVEGAKQDVVIAVAVGNYSKWRQDPLTAPTTAVAQDELINIHILGAQAGKNPVSVDKSTKESAKEVQNDRSKDSTKESVINSLFGVYGYANITFDGFASSGYGCYFIYAASSNLNLVIKNHYAEKPVPLTSGGSTPTFLYSQPNSIAMYEVRDSYLKLNAANAAPLSSEFSGNKAVFDNCVFTEAPNLALMAFKYYPNTKSVAQTNAAYYGEYATNPTFELKNSVIADWDFTHFFEFPVNDAKYTSWSDNAVKINISNNKFYDNGSKTHSYTLFASGMTTDAARVNCTEINITGNLFSYSDEKFATKGTDNESIHVGYPSAGAKITIKDNIFKSPNNTSNKVVHVNGNSQSNTTDLLDMSGNLFMDNQGNIMPLLVYRCLPEPFVHGYNVLSDIYASDEMEGGVRELMTVTEVEDGVAAYCFIQTRHQKWAHNYLSGALTLLLKDGKEYDADTLIKTSCEDVEFMGIYTEEACENKVDTVTKDTINGKFAKLQYKTDNTTLTVVYTLNTPSKLHIVDPSNTYKTSGYNFNGDVYTAGNATFYTSIADAYAAAKAPYQNDLIADSKSPCFVDDTNKANTNNLNDLIVLVPGEYNIGELTVSKSVAIVGPQWDVSPYGDANKEGKLANLRSANTATEAVINGTFVPTDIYSFVLDGVAFTGADSAFDFSKKSGATGSVLQDVVIKNCVFKNTAASIIKGVTTADDKKVLDVTIKDSAYDATDLNRSTANAPLITFRANFCTVENFAVINDNTCATNRMAEISMTNGAQVKWNAKRCYADFNNITIYNSKRDGVFYALGTATTPNANKTYYSAGAELNITNWYVTGGEGYFFGVEGSAAGKDFVKLTAKNNYFNRPDHNGYLVKHLQQSNTEIDPYSDASVFEGNAFIVKDDVKFDANTGNLNIDKNFYGKSVNNKVVPTYASMLNGVEKDLNTYWVNPEMTVKNTDLGLVNNGYKSIQSGEFKGYNQYTIDATNITATPAIFKAAQDASIVGVYTNEACTTAATAFTHPQDVYVKVTKGEFTLVNKVALDCACSHDGKTYEDIVREPSCTLDGIKGNFCEYCDEQIGTGTSIPATGNHQLGDLIVDINPTCTTAGSGHRSCTVCFNPIVIDIVIPTVADAHGWNIQYTVDIESTCTTRGSESIHCGHCDAKKPGSEREAALKPHAWKDEYTVDSTATCLTGGTKSIRCADCNAKKEGSEVEIPMGQHEWNGYYTVDIESTCNFSGLESIHCSKCNSIQVGSSRDLPYSDHHWSREYFVDKAPTCHSKGSKSFHCIDCLEINKDSIVVMEETEHSWNGYHTIDRQPSCFSNGQSSEHCSNCDAYRDVTVLPAEHSQTKTAYLVTPTYQEGGLRGEVCAICGTVIHQWAVGAFEGEATDSVFDDIYSDDWFYENDAVNFVYNMGLMNGTSEYTFSPNATLTRGMFVTILGRISGVDANGSGKTAFKDVSPNAYYAPYIKWAADEGIVSGYSASEFRPEGNITREQICKMILEFCNAEGITAKKVNKEIKFKDASKISSYAKEYVKTCQMSGLINGEKSGDGYIFRPQDTASRAEAATIIRNFCYTYIIK